MKKRGYTGDEAIWELKGECDAIEKMKVKKVGEKWIIRFYTRIGTVFELTVTEIKERPMMKDEKYMDWVEEEKEEEEKERERVSENV